MNNKEKQIREEFKKLVILGCHPGKSHEEALEEEFTGELINESSDGKAKTYRNCQEHFLITIGRVMQALLAFPTAIERYNHKPNILSLTFHTQVQCKLYPKSTDRFNTKVICVHWKLTKENGQEADDDFQELETIEKLLNLLKK